MNYVDDLEDENLLEADEIDLLEADGERDVENEETENPEPDGNAGSAPAAEPESTKKRIVRKPLPKLNPDRLKGPRGLIVLKTWFKDIEFKGKGHEKKDLDTVMGRLEQWTHRLFPKFTFDDALSRIEKLGQKSEVANYVKRIRLDMVDEGDEQRNDEIVQDDENDVADTVDPFDLVLNQNNRANENNVPPVQTCTLTDEQRERMVRNRLLAEERRLNRAKIRAEEEARLKQLQEHSEGVVEET